LPQGEACSERRQVLLPEPTQPHGGGVNWHRRVVHRSDGRTAVRSRGGTGCGSSVPWAQALQHGHPAARAGDQDGTSARRVLAQRGTAASVPAEFKTMALSFGADRLLDTVLRPGSEGGFSRLASLGVPPTAGPQGLAGTQHICGACLWAGGVEGFGFPPFRSAFRTCPEATQWKVLVTFLSI